MTGSESSLLESSSGLLKSTGLDATLNNFLRVCFESQADPALINELSEGDPRRAARFDVYRHMVRYRLVELLWTALPRTRAYLGAATFDAYAESRVSAAPPKTRFFREVVAALVDPNDKVFEGGHARDLVRLELASWQANFGDHALPALKDFSFEERPVMNPGVIRLDLDYTVYQLDHEIEKRPCHVAVYRRPDHRIETRWMGGTLAALFDAWALGETSAIEAVKTTLAARGETPTPTFIDGMTSFVEALLNTGALLGSRA